MKGLMTREPGITCFKDFSTSALPRLYFPIFFSPVYAMPLLLILFFTSPAFADEPKVYTDADLVNYKAEPMVDQESLSRMEDDLKSYEKKSDAAFLLDREKGQRQQAVEAKRAALQKQKQDATVSRTSVSSQDSGHKSGVPYVLSPISTRRT